MTPQVQSCFSSAFALFVSLIGSSNSRRGGQICRTKTAQLKKDGLFSSVFLLHFVGTGAVQRIERLVGWFVAGEETAFYLMGQ